ncbi:Pentatricopeptide repeat-containing protein [Hordeum vulgare]|nr:Pentatricopeptide repeat-containing protein [Hordeum vulgare]
MDRNIVSWTAMVSGYAQNGRHEEVMGAFLEMWEGAGVQPNELTVSSVLPVCLAVGAMELGMKVEEYARGKGHLRNVFVTNALLEMYSKCGSIQRAWQIRNNGNDICLEIAAKRDDLLSEVVEATSWLGHLPTWSGPRGAQAREIRFDIQELRPGRMFLRLYFCPGEYYDDDGDYAISNAFFGVTTGNLVLLNDFNVSQTAQDISFAYLVCEFSVNVSSGSLHLTFAP